MGGTGAVGELRGDSICAAVTCPSVTKTTTLCATCSTNKRAICSSQAPSLARKSWRKTGKRRSECRMLQLWGAESPDALRRLIAQRTRRRHGDP